MSIDLDVFNDKDERAVKLTGVAATRGAETKIQTWFDKVAALCIARGAPEGWEVSVSELLGTYPTYTHYKIDGAVYGKPVPGRFKGKPIDGTKMTFIFSNAEIHALSEPAEGG